MTTFGGRLRQLRREAGLSQADLAGEELSASYVSLLESGKRTPSHDVVQLLAARLGCSGTQLVDGQPSDRDQRLDLELAYARLAIEHGESADARNRLSALLAEDGLPRRLRDDAILLLGMALHRLNNYSEAVRALLPLHERSLSRQTHISALETSLALCRCYLDTGDINRAATSGERGLEAGRRQGLSGTNDYFRLAASVMAAHMLMGDFMHARIRAQALIAEAEASGQVAGQAGLYWNSAVLAELEGRLDEALRLCERALARMSELDNLREYALLRLAVAQILLSMDARDAERAGTLLLQALPDLRDHGSHSDLATWNRSMSAVLLHQGDLSGAEGRARQALDLLGDAAAEEHVQAWMAMTDALVAQGRTDEARECLDHARDHARRARDGRASAPLWRELAERRAEAGDLPAAFEACQRALDAAGVRDRSAAVRGVVARRRRESAGVSAPPALIRPTDPHDRSAEPIR